MATFKLDVEGLDCRSSWRVYGGEHSPYIVGRMHTSLKGGRRLELNSVSLVEDLKAPKDQRWHLQSGNESGTGSAFSKFFPTAEAAREFAHEYWRREIAAYLQTCRDEANRKKELKQQAERLDALIISWDEEGGGDGQ